MLVSATATFSQSSSVSPSATDRRQTAMPSS